VPLTVTNGALGQSSLTLAGRSPVSFLSTVEAACSCRPRRRHHAEAILDSDVDGG
jgi:hypothetical protein